MTSQTKAKQVISELVKRYEQVKLSGSLKKYTEEETKKDFIMPLFRALGWDIDNKQEVTAEEKSTSTTRSDFGFYLDGWPKFFLEAKALRADLHDERFAKQAIRYSWNKGLAWAVLTDFESLIVFNAQDIAGDLAHKLFFEIKYSEYLDRFDQLWLLSKAAFIDNLLDQEAEKVGKKLLKVSVTEKLYKDLNECREILIKSLRTWNKDVPNELLDEGVQRLLDRLIFLRVAEDRKLEPPTLIPMLRAWDNDSKRSLYQSMIKEFRELDSIYNSNLFTPHPFEKWEEYDGATEKVINILYGKPGYYEYDFKAIPADILGSVYENYLGYQLAQSVKGVEVSKDARKRKEQGIYYTPRYIVDYIVTNALKPVLDRCESVQDLKNIKVLDPACGSGSFLIKALDLIYKKYLEFGAKPGEMTKITILLDNIFGVDLDEKAVEIARLNLLINALDSRMKLPALDKNIKHGNSLISGTDEELEQYFGKNYRDKVPFNWQHEFPQVFDRKNPGFDVIIGNPPWVFTRGENFSEAEKRYFDNFLTELGIAGLTKGRQVQSGKLNLYSLFLLLGVKLVRNNGQISFIVPNNILRATNFDLVRKFLLDSTSISEIVDLGAKVFSGVTASSVILALDKKSNGKKNTRVLFDISDLPARKYKSHEVEQKSFYDNPSFAFNILSGSGDQKISAKIQENSDSLGNICKYIIEGIVGSTKRDVADKKMSGSYKKFLVGKNIGRYKIRYKNKWINYDRKVLHRARPEEVFLSNKILVQRIGGGNKPIAAVIDRDNYYTFASINNIVLKEGSGYSLEYVLGLLNSNLINWYYSLNFSNRSELTVNISKTFLEQLPVRKAVPMAQKQIATRADKILRLYKELENTAENSNKWHSIKSEIEKTDHEIDQLVYKLYDLTPKEIKIVGQT